MTNSAKKAAPASVQAQAATKPPVAKPAAKRVAKAAAKAATKPVAKPAVQATAKPTTKAAAKPASKAAEKMDAPAVAAKPAKVKVVRDSFTIPSDEYAVLGKLKQRALTAAHHAKKSELLRAGIKLLASLDDAALVRALMTVPAIKTGRPKAKKGE